jgi:hypothetical protein
LAAGFHPDLIDSAELKFAVTAEEWYTVTGPAAVEMTLTFLDARKNVVERFNQRKGCVDINRTLLILITLKMMKNCCYFGRFTLNQ